MESTKNKIINICKSSVKASQYLSKTKNAERNKALKIIAKKIIKNKDHILVQNKKDLAIAKKSGLSKPLIDRLLLDESRILNLSKDVLNIA